MGWYNSSWLYRKQFVTDSTKVAGTSHTDFPIAVVHPKDGDFYSKCRSDGYDILFTAADGTTKLDHEIDYWSTNGYMICWVRIPSLSGTANQTFYMYYGNASATDQQNVSGTWNSGFQGVYHLGESSGQALDSSGNGNHLNVNGSPTRADAGIMGSGCVNITASGQNFRATATSVHNYTGDMTVSAIVKPDAPTAGRHQAIAGKGDNQYMLRIDLTGNAYCIFTYDGDWQNAKWASAANTNWAHVAGVHDGTRLSLCVDGTEAADTATQGINADTGAYFQLGANYDYSSRWWDGKIDEVRVSNVARSVDWLDTEYENSVNNSTFFSTALASGTGEETGGYSNEVNTVTSIGKINGVDAGNISSVNTV